MMTAAFLLALFEPFFQGGYLDSSKPGFEDVLGKLTEDQAVYVSIAKEAFAEYMLHTDDPSCLDLEKIIDILRVLLYLDGRSEQGLLKVADLAYDNPRHSAEATNALAALASYYRSGGQPSVPPRELIHRFERYMKNLDLFHNARECRNALQASRPNSTCQIVLRMPPPARD